MILFFIVFLHKPAVEGTDPTDLIPGFVTQFGSYDLYHATGSYRTYLGASADIESVAERMKKTSRKQVTGTGGIGTTGGYTYDPFLPTFTTAISHCSAITCTDSSGLRWVYANDSSSLAKTMSTYCLIRSLRKAWFSLTTL